MNRTTFFVLFLALVFVVQLTGITVTIGSGTTTSYQLPIRAYYDWSCSQQIYDQTLINQPGTIEKIRFYKNNTATITSSNIWRIHLGHTTKTAFNSNSDWISIFDMTQVFYGTITFASTAGWQEITLQTPFFYNNVDNLVIAVDEDRSGSNNTTAYWRITDTAANTALVYSSNTTNPNPTAYSNGIQQTQLNQIQLEFTYLNHHYLSCIIPQGTIDHQHDLDITNIDTADLQITSITDNASWLSVSPSLPVTVAPGDTWQTELTVDATGLTATAPYTIYNATVTITTSSGTFTMPFELKVIYYSQPTNPRHVAQWEPARGAIIRYPFGLPNQLISDMIDDEENLWVVCSNATTAEDALDDFLTQAQLDKVIYIIGATDTYWIRDWGPLSMFEDDGMGGRRLCMIDFDYNRDNRPLDEAMIPTIAAGVGVPYYFIPMSLTGGNILTDGAKVEYADEWVIMQNDGDVNTGQDGTTSFNEKYSYSPHQFDTLVSYYRGDLLGEGFRSFIDPQPTYIHHIDCWAKLLCVDRVLIADGMGGNTERHLDAIASYWATLQASNGNNYQVFRVNCPNNEPYTNSFILNDEIYIPFWGTNSGASGGTQTANDTAAIAAYNTALAGLDTAYTVRGYIARNGAAWVSTDAIHCRVHTIHELDEEPPLSVELSTFTVTISSSNLPLLTWMTQFETNVSGFGIYRGNSNELGEALDLGVFIEATNTSQTQTYIYQDTDIWEHGSYYYWLESRDLDGSNQIFGPVSIVIEHGGNVTPPVPIVTGINSIYPNPFNPSTIIAYGLEKESEVEILIYNTRGQLVNRLLCEAKEKGNHQLAWNGRDKSGRQCGSGVYNVLMRVGTEIFTRKAVLLK